MKSGNEVLTKLSILKQLRTNVVTDLNSIIEENIDDKGILRTGFVKLHLEKIIRLNNSIDELEWVLK